MIFALDLWGMKCLDMYATTWYRNQIGARQLRHFFIIPVSALVSRKGVGKMSKTIVQINFNYDLAEEELNEGAKELVQPVQQVPNLVWKTWIVNDQEKLTGGIYLFENEEAAKAYVEGPLINQLRNSPAFKNLSIKLFDIMEEQSKATRAPI
jgi:hypothetical protein